MRLVTFVGLLVLTVSSLAAPSIRLVDSTVSKEPKTPNESFVYSLFLKLMSTGSLKTWLNQHILNQQRNKPQFFFGPFSNKVKGGQPLTNSGASATQKTKEDASAQNVLAETSQDSLIDTNTSPAPAEDLTIVRDHILPSTPSMLQGTTQQPQTGSTKKFNIPVIILTDPDANDLVVDQNEDLTIVRDYPHSSTTQSSQNQQQQGTRRRRAVYSLPMVKLAKKDEYDNPSGNTPQTGSLTDGDGEDLVMVRDKTSSDEPTSNSGNSNPVYSGGTAANTGQSSSGTQPKVFRIRFYECPNKPGWCFELV